MAHQLGVQYIVSSTGEAHFGEEEGTNDEVLVKNIKEIGFTEDYTMRDKDQPGDLGKADKAV